MWSIEKEECLKCGTCVGVCPRLALELRGEGIVHNQDLCNSCGLCKKTCPVGAIEVIKSD